jgi:ubiquinone/menaquinone biosynthesis C-methylase UbiE
MRVLLIAILLLACAAPSAQGPHVRNGVWQQQYQARSALSMAEQFESASRPVYRYRVAIVDMLELEPGMSVADIGAGSGFLARLMAKSVGPSGRVFANELEPKMVAYMADRARSEGIVNFTAVQGKADSTGLDPASVNAVVMTDAFSYFDRPDEMLRSVATALKPGGLLLSVDLPREGQGASATGVDADDVVAAAKQAGLERQNEITLVPGQYAIRFRKP